MCVVRLRAPTIGDLNSCWDVGFCYINDLDFPGDQRPILKASIAFFPPKPSSLKISCSFYILKLECNFNQYWCFWALCASCYFSERWFWDWKAPYRRLQTSCHPVVIIWRGVFCKSASWLFCLNSECNVFLLLLWDLKQFTDIRHSTVLF